jgi:hypothetical protein
MTVRRILLWVGANVVFVLALGAGCVAWAIFAGPRNEFSGPSASGGGGLIVIGRGILLVFLGALATLNLAWFAFVVRKR